MKVVIRRIPGGWNRALNKARKTQGKSFTKKEPSENWKEKLIVSQHSPLRCIWYDIELIDIPYWCSVHFVRHHQGIEHFVTTQRIGLESDRSKRPQGALVNHSFEANAEAILNISNKRLCMKAASITRNVWQKLLEELKNIEPLLVKWCLPSCKYRRGCPEFKSCGLEKSLI